MPLSHYTAIRTLITYVWCLPLPWVIPNKQQTPPIDGKTIYLCLTYWRSKIFDWNCSIAQPAVTATHGPANKLNFPPPLELSKPGDLHKFLSYSSVYYFWKNASRVNPTKFTTRVKDGFLSNKFETNNSNGIVI